MKASTLIRPVSRFNLTSMATRINPLLWIVGLVAAIGTGLAAAVDVQYGVTAALFFLLFVLVISVRYTAWATFVIATWVTGLGFDVGPATVRMEHLALLLLAATYLSQIRQRSPSPSSRRLASVGGAIVLMIAWLLLGFLTSVLVAPESTKSLWMWTQIVLAVSVLLFASRLEHKVQLMTAGNRIAMAIGVLCLVAYVLAILGVPLNYLYVIAPDMRVVGFSFEANIFASQALIWLCLNYYWRALLPKWTRLANGALFVLVVLAGTRSAWLGLLVLIFVWIWSHRARGRGSAVALALLFAAGGILVFLSAPQSVNAADDGSLSWRLLHILDTSGGTGAYRVDIYSTAFADIETRGQWLFGSGINSFSQYHEIDTTGVQVPYLSSLWVGLIYDVGLVGLTLFLLFFFALLTRSARFADSLPLFAAFAICASATNLIWFAYPWLAIGLLDWSRGGRSPDIGVVAPSQVQLLRRSSVSDPQ
jgi:hypothetical protein